MRTPYHFLVLIGLSFLLNTCQTRLPQFETPVLLTEDFESGEKSDFERENIAFESGDWVLYRAKVGTSNNDKKRSRQSIRIVGDGTLTMNFDVHGRIDQIKVLHATHGDHDASDWELWYSSNQGTSWHKIGGTISSASTLDWATFNVNIQGMSRFEIRKVSGFDAAINIDNFIIGNTAIDEPEDNRHLLFGNPSNAENDLSSEDNFLMSYTQFDLSYNRSKNIPNWVAWHLDENWLGEAERQDDFRADDNIPNDWYKTHPDDYLGSGFDRGHLCPSADRSISSEDNSATFLMTNIIPQSPDNNQGPWVDLENYCRDLVREGHELYVIAGQYGLGGAGSNGESNVLRNNVVVPAHVWKIILVLPEGTNDVNRVDENTRLIAVDIPNQQGIRSSAWKNFRVSVDDIEELTSFNFLSELAIDLQDILESTVDND